MRRVILLCAALLLANCRRMRMPSPTSTAARPSASISAFRPAAATTSTRGSWRRISRAIIPGNPIVTMHNMDGGVGVRAAHYITNVTPQDGTSLGLFLDTITMSKILGGPGDFDPVKLVWIGRIARRRRVAMVWHTSPAQTVDEVKRKEITMAATSAGASSTSMIASALNDNRHTKFNIMRGYQGSPPMALAMERGEVHAMAAWRWRRSRPPRGVADGEEGASCSTTSGCRRLKDQPEAPALVDLAIDERSRAHPRPVRWRRRRRPLVRGGARHAARSRGGLAHGVHGEMSDPCFRRRHGQAQSRRRAAERGGGAEDHRSGGRDTCGTGTTGWSLSGALACGHPRDA